MGAPSAIAVRISRVYHGAVPRQGDDRIERHPGFLSTELANSVTHGVGLLFSIAGLVLLVVLSAQSGGVRRIVACSIYGTTLVLLYLASTLYHSARSVRAKRVLRVVDHSAIYLLIAGTYTPFTLVSLRGAWGWSIFGVVWGLAALGILFKTVYIGKYAILSGLVYLFMGWMCVFAIGPMLESIPVGGLILLGAGGLAYTLGMIFFAWKVVPHHHAVWHVFVMLGSMCHFFAVMLYVVPNPV